MKIIVLILFCLIGFGMGLSIKLNHTESSAIEGTTCQGEICLPPDEYLSPNTLERVLRNGSD